MARNYAAVPHEYLDEMQELSDEEFGRLMRALLVYSSTGQEIQPTGNERYSYRRVLAQEDRYQQSYDDIEGKRAEKAKKAAAARWHNDDAQACTSNAQNAQACTSIPSNAQNANTETNTETNISPTNVGDIDKKRAKRFVPPTAEEVREYCQTHGYDVDAAHFVDYYTANGWRVGKQNMKDWKAAVRNWTRNNFASEQKTTPKRSKGGGVPASSMPQGGPTAEDIARMKKTLQKISSG